MDQFINSLPRGVLAFLAILGGFIFIVLNDPPKTICDSQIEYFRDSQKKFLYSADAEIKKPALIKELYNLCKGDNSPGGCFELFVHLKKLSVDLEAVPDECGEKITSKPQLGEWYLKTMRLMVLLAWGDRAPASAMHKHGWYDASELVLFCDLKRSATRFYGAEAMKTWRESVMKDLPQAGQLNREQVWSKSLLSAPCDVYR